MRLKEFTRTVCLVLTATLAVVGQAAAEDNGEIRDAEIETIIRTFATPIWQAAGLNPDDIHIYLVNDNDINSFVAGGQNIFLNTGLILRSETPNQLIGVIAHETGHIAGGHLARSEEAMEHASIASIIGMVIGAAAAVGAHGNGDAGAAVAAGGTLGIQTFTHFSLVQEASADHAALSFLDRSQMSSRGLLEFFEILEQQEYLSPERQSSFLRDHPLTTERVNYVREHVESSPWSNAVDPPSWILMHKIMKAKLSAFLDPPGTTLATLKPDDTSVPTRYARAIAYYRIPDLKNAVPAIDGLIHDDPDNPYYQELKGQMLFENGRIAEAVAPYQEAVRLKPGNALLEIELAQVELETNDPAMVPKAKLLLTNAVHFEDRNPEAWRLLAIAYGKSDNMGMMALSLAQQGMAAGDYGMARQQAARAVKLLAPGADRQQAEDIAADAQRNDHH